MRNTQDFPHDPVSLTSASLTTPGKGGKPVADYGAVVDLRGSRL